MNVVRRAAIAALAATVLVTGCAVLLPSAPVAAVATPTLTLFRGETLATNAEGSAQGTLNRLRATLVINHPVGVTVNQMRRRTGQHVSFTGWGAVEGTVRTISGVSGNYSVVEAAWVPGTSSWGGCFTGSVRWCDRMAEVDVLMSDGTVLGGDWTYRAQTEVQSNGEEDPPTMYDNHDTTVNGTFTGSGTLRLHYRCDDNDSSGDHDACDNVAIRVRNLASGATTLLQCSDSTVNCENGTKFNADDNSERNGTIPIPAAAGRGRFVIEGMFCSESQRGAGTTDCSSTGSGWQWMGSYTMNPGAPSVSFGTPTFTGGGTVVGGVARPNTGATVTYPVTSPDAQVALWDLNDDGTGETVELGESGDTAGAPVLAAAHLARGRSTVGLAEGAGCRVRVQVRDNGGLNAADPTSALSSQVTSPACTVNRQPTGASQTGLPATKGVAVPVTLANADGDGDPRTCEQVGGAANGSVTFAGCSASFTAAPDTSGTASFQYRVLDDHAGVSPTYTVSLAIQNRAPTSADFHFGAVEVGGEVEFPLGGSDPDGDTTTCAVTQPTGGSLSGEADCVVTYHAPTTPGTHTFTYTRSDGFGGTSDPATVTVRTWPEPGIRGRVTADDTGEGIAGVKVYLYQFGFTSHVATTDATGHYDMGQEELPGCSCSRLFFKDPSQDHVDEWTGGSITRSGASDFTYWFPEEAIVDASLATGAEVEVDIANPGSFTVALYNAAPGSSSAYRSTPNVSGSTTFRGLPAGTYYVSVSDPADMLVQEWSGNQTVRTAAVGIPVGTGETVETSFSLATRNTIAGTVIDSGGPVPLVTVQAYAATSGAFVRSTKTDAEGEYVLRDMAPGGYKLVFRDTSGAHPVVWSGGGEVIGSASTVTMVSGGAVTVDEELPVAATVTGTVTGGPDGATPLAGAKVTLYRNGMAAGTVTTDASGLYVATGLSAGGYVALFTAPGHRSEYNLDRPRKADADVVVVEAGATVTLDATLAPT